MADEEQQVKIDLDDLERKARECEAAHENVALPNPPGIAAGRAFFAYAEAMEPKTGLALIAALREIASAVEDSEDNCVGGGEFYSLDWLRKIEEVLARFGLLVDKGEVE